MNVRTNRIRTMVSALAAASVGAAALLGAPAASAGTATASTGTAAAGAPSFPTFVHLPADQAAHPGTQNEWWYVVGHLTAGGHRFGYEVQIIVTTNAVGAATPPETEVAITDQTTGQYFTNTSVYTPAQTSFSSTSLDAVEPTATLTGPMNAMHLTATMPSGSINLTLDALGPALYSDGTGLMPFLGGSSYYYSLPDVASAGTIVENGQTYRVAGQSWLDHQWGDWDWGTALKWTWMSLQLADGDSLNLWDIFSSGTENSYATVLHPDGSEQIVAVDPLAPGTSGFVTSPTTGQRYGSCWQVDIPSLGAHLKVVASPRLQEIQDLGGIFEGDSDVTGSYQGSPIVGKAYVEQLGDWQP
jgi:predicted secreted hydrolase